MIKFHDAVIKLFDAIDAKVFPEGTKLVEGSMTYPRLDATYQMAVLLDVQDFVMVTILDIPGQMLSIEGNYSYDVMKVIDG